LLDQIANAGGSKREDSNVRHTFEVVRYFNVTDRQTDGHVDNISDAIRPTVLLNKVHRALKPKSTENSQNSVSNTVIRECGGLLVRHSLQCLLQTHFVEAT